MRTLTFSLVVLSFVVVGAASCSSSDSTPAPAAGGSAGSAGTAGAAGTGGTAGAAGTGGAAGTAGAAGQGPDAGTNQCTNTADMAAVQATYPIADAGDLGVPDIAAICGKGCLGSADSVKCTTDCIRQNTSNAVSEGCAGCFSASVKCTIDNCLSECIADAAAPACIACRCGTNTDSINCFEAYTACSGIPSSACTPSDGGTEGGGQDAAGE